MRYGRDGQWGIKYQNGFWSLRSDGDYGESMALRFRKNSTGVYGASTNRGGKMWLILRRYKTLLDPRICAWLLGSCDPLARTYSCRPRPWQCPCSPWWAMLSMQYNSQCNRQKTRPIANSSSKPAKFISWHNMRNHRELTNSSLTSSYMLLTSCSYYDISMLLGNLLDRPITKMDRRDCCNSCFVSSSLDTATVLCPWAMSLPSLSYYTAEQIAPLEDWSYEQGR